MKHFLILLAILSWFSTLAQKSGQTDFEVGLSGGISWYNGDLNPNAHFNSNYYNRAFGVSIRRNLNQRFALRFQGNYGTLSADDAISNSTFQQSRNLNFSTELYEFASTIEFNFLEYDPLVKGKHFSPYTFIGLSLFYFNPITEIEGNIYDLHALQTEGRSYSRVSVAVPFGMGFKWAISDRILIGADWGLRRTFTDYLDDVSDRYPSKGELDGLSEDISDRSLQQSGPDGTNWGTQRGNSITKDWYSFAFATLSIRLGPKKGSCKHLRI